MIRYLLLAVLLLAIAAPVAAQDSSIVRVPTPTPIEDCPAGLVCVEIEGGVVLDIDPTCGPVVAVIVEEDLARTTEFANGEVVTTEAYGVRGLVLIQTGDTYEVAGDFRGPAAGPLDPARFGSVGCLDWSATDG